MSDEHSAPSAADHDGAPRRLSRGAKYLVDLGPLAVFFVVYFFGRKLAPFVGGLVGKDWAIADGRELFLAVAAYMPVFAIAAIVSIAIERRVSPMLLISFVVVGVLGSLTLIFQDKTFFYMKPTIAYGLFAAVLSAGLFTGRNFLKAAFDGALTLPDAAWHTLTVRYTVFFAVLCVAHEIIWRWLMRDCDIHAGPRCAGEPIWVNVKLFGFTGINMLFAMAQAPLIVRHLEDHPGDKTDPPTDG